MKSPLREIPGVGARIAAVMEALGIREVSDLRGRDPEELYLKECLMKGYQEDRCALYVWRAAVYYAGHETRDPEKLKWWYWKNKPYPEKEDL
ncbi:helix-hairpin-helix domain-containing protein [uncultured Oscillibacter sp.]|uniref:helix-hairpin-helix domain-containing protein n=1 Tax=uncultured Oscillibacter sp. TaxID=876091 RepID=UPI00262F39C1|nr:helix-hairpin-helix domain-containing protein [uncultured Oscillibacter sp.]